MGLNGSAEFSGVLRGKITGLETLQGYSAYEIAVINGFSGTEEEWLASLRGESAYDVAVRNGYEGTEAEYYADLALFDERAQAATKAEQNTKALEESASADASAASKSATEAADSANSANAAKEGLQAAERNAKASEVAAKAAQEAAEEAAAAALGALESPARIGEVALLASAWTGSGSLYSQVVSIDGVTERSQVDLTPSVEQLAAFYEKDLTLVTENEDGVVTVYAIGQKPTNDYTIQVTITEVRV